MSYDEKFDMAMNFLRDEDGLEDYLVKKGIGSPVEWLAVRIYEKIINNIIYTISFLKVGDTLK